MEKELKVAALRNGTVIDHIPADKLFQVVSVLRLKYYNHPITIGNNFDSKRMGTKGIIKISDRFLEVNEASKIALIAPNARINIIKEYQVVEKRTLILGDEIYDVMHCANPVCITNHQPVPTKFLVIRDGNQIRLKCCYCEREVKQDEVKIKKN
ncbi:MAG: aspartate carbamoyltransferase regulatory subunit [Paludibacter sp.]|nr:aspartate carbamoyltransferase regulatory subunit [Paludibacter sp.]